MITITSDFGTVIKETTPACQIANKFPTTAKKMVGVLFILSCSDKTPLVPASVDPTCKPATDIPWSTSRDLLGVPERQSTGSTPPLSHGAIGSSPQRAFQKPCNVASCGCPQRHIAGSFQKHLASC